MISSMPNQNAGIDMPISASTAPTRSSTQPGRAAAVTPTPIPSNTDHANAVPASRSEAGSLSK